MCGIALSHARYVSTLLRASTHRYAAAGQERIEIFHRFLPSSCPRSWLRPPRCISLSPAPPRTPLRTFPRASWKSSPRFPTASLKRQPRSTTGRGQMEERHPHTYHLRPPHLVSRTLSIPLYSSVSRTTPPLLAPEPDSALPPCLHVPSSPRSLHCFALILTMRSSRPARHQLPLAAWPRVQQPPLPTRLHRRSLAPPRLASSSSSDTLHAAGRSFTVHTTPSLHPEGTHGVHAALTASTQRSRCGDAN